MATVAVVHNNVDQRSAIGKLAAWSVQVALDAGHAVVVVARDLDPSLREHVQWKPLFVPPRLFAVQWAAARTTVRAALRGTSYDVLHVFQPQLARIADTWHAQYLTRAALDNDVRFGAPVAPSPRSVQTSLVGRMEDAYLSSYAVKGGATALFCSPYLQREFTSRYGAPQASALLPNPAFNAPAPPRTARDGLLRLGFLGGNDPRKGVDVLLAAALEVPSVEVHLAGSGASAVVDPGLGARLVRHDYVDDVPGFLAGVDALVVPSRFEPFGLVVAEAAAAGIPSIVTPEVGAADLAVSVGAAHLWSTRSAAELASICASLAVEPAACRALVARLDPAQLGAELLQAWGA